MKEPLQLKITPGTGKEKFQCRSLEYDGGDPIGYGDTIQEAIKQFLVSFQLKFNSIPKYKWS